ncbi:MAG: alpha/beta hydrolase-fold protein [Sphingopyxis sp.]|nr:alpha/beta hydrolase-fold protein [Sphingopyxis sp.]
MARILALLALLIAVPAWGQADGRLVEWTDVSSRHVQPRSVTIWLPPGYDQTSRRYPVIYMHDGQNVFTPGRAYGGEEWGVDEALSRMIAAGRTRGAIVVGVWNTNLRGREYLPAAIVAALPADMRRQVETTHNGPSLADAYLRFLVEELKPRVDRTYRTRRGRVDTSIMGSSMGGLISLYALGEYPSVFGAAAAVSIHWPLGDPRRGQGADPAAVASAFDQWLDGTAVRPGRNRLYIDIGDQTLDAFYPPYQTAMAPVLSAHGWQDGPRHALRTFPGTAHNEASWRARVEIPLAFLLRR